MTPTRETERRGGRSTLSSGLATSSAPVRGESRRGAALDSTRATGLRRSARTFELSGPSWRSRFVFGQARCAALLNSTRGLELGPSPWACSSCSSAPVSPWLPPPSATACSRIGRLRRTPTAARLSAASASLTSAPRQLRCARFGASMIHGRTPSDVWSGSELGAHTAGARPGREGARCEVPVSALS